MNPTSEDAVASVPAPARRNGPGMKIVVAVALFAFLAGLAGMAWYLSPWGASKRIGEPSTANTPVNAALDPATMEAPQLAAPAVPPRAAAVPADMAAARVAEMEQRLARLAVDAQAASSYANRAEAMLIAFAARRALDTGSPLGYLEGQMRVIFGEGQPKAVATVINAAREPVTIPLLRQRLEGLRAVVLRGDPRAGWWDGLMHGIGNLAVVRSANAPAPEPEQRLSAARLAVEAGQMDEAIRQVSALPARPEMTAWLELARRYNEGRRALDVIEAAAVIEPRVTLPAAVPVAAGGAER